MTSEKILDALNGLDGRFVREARAENKRTRGLTGRRFVVLLAAVIALMAVTVTAFASEAVTSWFRQYFGAKTEETLTPGQVEYIEENEQVIAEAKEENGWTVELRSAISDGTKAYIIIGVTAPEGVNLEPRVENGSLKDWYGAGNAVTTLMDVVSPSIPDLSVEENYYYQLSYGWREDGDGLANTMNMVFELVIGRCHPNEECSLKEPFGADVDFTIHIEDIVREYDDEEYRRELMEGKYAGQTDVMFTPEETQRLRQVETLVEGTWDFTVNFGENGEGVELISEPIAVYAYVWDEEDPDNMFDGKRVYQEVTITSFILNPLSAVIQCNDSSANFGDMYAVMEDGSRVLLKDYGTSIEAEIPIVLSEVDHILMADGTEIPMPE